MRGAKSWVWWTVWGWLMIAGSLNAQDTTVPEGPKPRETFEDDKDGDGIPDGWYNLRDARVVDHGHGGGSGAKCFRFENQRPGRPARASRAFGVDGRAVEAVIVGAWVRAEEIAPGERLGDEPGLVIDFLGDPVQLKAVRRGLLGPWKTIGPEWTHVAKRLPIPPDTRLAILSMGLIGATGVLEVDDLTIELVPVGGQPTNNLVTNGDFELGDPDAAGWTTDRGSRRVSPGYESPAAVELKGAGARVYAGLGLPVARFTSLEVSATVRGTGLRGANGALGLVFFLDDDGRPLAGMQDGVRALSFNGSFGWTPSRGRVDIPPGAARALVHFEKASAFGTLTVDDVRVVANDGSTRWTPYHVATVTSGWNPITPAPRVEADSALDASALLDAPAGKQGFVVVRDGRLAFERGGRARFFGVSLLPPTRLSRTKQGRRPRRSPGAVGGQSDPPGGAGHPTRPRAEPDQRHPRGHRGARPRRPGPARPPDRRRRGAGDLCGDRTPGGPPLPRRRHRAGRWPQTPGGRGTCRRLRSRGPRRGAGHRGTPAQPPEPRDRAVPPR